LKSRGLSIVGNKSELIARLASALDTSSQSLDVNHGSHIEDSALEDQLLGDDSVADTSLSTKTDDHLIDDLLDANETKAGTAIKVVSKTAVTGNSISKGTLSPTKTIVTNPSSPTKSTSDSEAKQDSTANVKTTTAVKVLSAEERKQLRAQKFGDNKLTERATRFGIKPEVDSTANKV
jgi:hypothetical protein